MNYKLRIIMCALFATVAAVFGSLAFSDFGVEEDRVVTCMAQDEPAFVVRELEGFVAVYFKGDDKAPVTVTDISVESLRDFDKKLMRNGVFIPSRERLLMMLEDLGS